MPRTAKTKKSKLERQLDRFSKNLERLCRLANEWERLEQSEDDRRFWRDLLRDEEEPSST